MAIPIKAIPSLYGEEARRMMRVIEENERIFEETTPYDWSHDARMIAVREHQEMSRRFMEEREK